MKNENKGGVPMKKRKKRKKRDVNKSSSTRQLVRTIAETRLDHMRAYASVEQVYPITRVELRFPRLTQAGVLPRGAR